MQSEFASHIGLRGRCFCRACKVEGAPRGRRKAGEQDDGSDYGGDDDDDDDDDVDMLPPLSDDEEGGCRPPSPAVSIGSQILSGHPQYQWTVAGIVDRLTAFINPGEPRIAIQTLKVLNGYYADASEVGNKERIKKKRTQTGVKDTFQQHFLDILHGSYKNRRTDRTKQEALDAKLATMGKRPEEMINPILRMHGLDPHADTPVEVLHVVLLGFVKYFWKDVIQNQIKNKPAKKELLAARLSSLDVSGLGLSPLAGRTLVQYAGSLVGRDFRAIAQVAPFVLKDLVSKECYETWKCLSKLVPLIWQPEIEHLASYIDILRYEINQFLLRTASWTSAWFNKPKFHILVHLPDHIKRFGPAILFATEAFESFNSVIRAKSVHSNRQAPSRDIARAFAQGNRIRHLVSGGKFQVLNSEDVQRSKSGRSWTFERPLFSGNRRHWKSIGSSAMALLKDDSTVSPYLGLSVKQVSYSFKHDPEATQAVPYAALKIAAVFPDAPRPVVAGHLFWKCVSCVLESGDKCNIGDFVIASDGPNLVVGRVEEIVQSQASSSCFPDAILVQRYDDVDQLGLGPDVNKENTYDMPYLVPTDDYVLADALMIHCTVNVQHACFDMGCGATEEATVWQERVETTQTRRTVKHASPLHRVVLNTAQMRDAAFVQPFRRNSKPLDAKEELTRSAEALRVRARAKAKDATHAATPSSPSTTARPPADSRVAALQQQSVSGPSNRPPLPHGTSSTGTSSRARQPHAMHPSPPPGIREELRPVADRAQHQRRLLRSLVVLPACPQEPRVHMSLDGHDY
ncbi:hypothetical protein NMY22_g6988 [Coprinellus aureogranulatus]|nr:hypothetical protein NMY22_g6988 [Coprinellus aureogranulatus]